MDSRAVAPVVGKVLVAGLAVLYISAMTTVLLGGVVPDYRAAAGDELGERVLATAGATVERATTDADGTVDVRVRADLPGTIRNAPYRLTLANGTLRLNHSTDAVDAQARIDLPQNLSVADGTWRSGDDLVVRVTGPPSNRTVSLVEGSS